MLGNKEGGGTGFETTTGEGGAGDGATRSKIVVLIDEGGTLWPMLLWSWKVDCGQIEWFGKGRWLGI